MHFVPANQATVRIIGEWSDGGSYEVEAYGIEASMPARSHLDNRWIPGFSAQLAKESGLPLAPRPQR